MVHQVDQVALKVSLRVLFRKGFYHFVDKLFKQVTTALLCVDTFVKLLEEFFDALLAVRVGVWLVDQ